MTGVDGESDQVCDTVRDLKAIAGAIGDLDRKIEGVSLSIHQAVQEVKKIIDDNRRRTAIRAPMGGSNRSWFHGGNNRYGDSDSLIAKFERNLPEFDGFWHEEDLTSWIEAIDDFFEEISPSEHLKCKIVWRKMKGAAYYWWKQLQDDRNKHGKEEITSWPRMKNMVLKRFLPAMCSTKVPFESCIDKCNMTSDSRSLGVPETQSTDGSIENPKKSTCIATVIEESGYEDSLSEQHLMRTIVIQHTITAEKSHEESAPIQEYKRVELDQTPAEQPHLKSLLVIAPQPRENIEDHFELALGTMLQPTSFIFTWAILNGKPTLSHQSPAEVRPYAIKVSSKIVDSEFPISGNYGSKNGSMPKIVGNFIEGSCEKSPCAVSKTGAIRIFREYADFSYSVHGFVSFLFDPGGNFRQPRTRSTKLKDMCGVKDCDMHIPSDCEAVKQKWEHIIVNKGNIQPIIGATMPSYSHRSRNRGNIYDENMKRQTKGLEKEIRSSFKVAPTQLELIIRATVGTNISWGAVFKIWVNYWNFQSRSEYVWKPNGRVCVLVVTNEMLMVAHHGSILAWKSNLGSDCTQLLVTLRGHSQKSLAHVGETKRLISNYSDLPSMRGGYTQIDEALEAKMVQLAYVAPAWKIPWDVTIENPLNDAIQRYSSDSVWAMNSAGPSIITMLTNRETRDLFKTNFIGLSLVRISYVDKWGDQAAIWILVLLIIFPTFCEHALPQLSQNRWGADSPVGQLMQCLFLFWRHGLIILRVNDTVKLQSFTPSGAPCFGQLLGDFLFVWNESPTEDSGIYLGSKRKDAHFRSQHSDGGFAVSDDKVVCLNATTIFMEQWKGGLNDLLSFQYLQLLTHIYSPYTLPVDMWYVFHLLMPMKVLKSQACTQLADWTKHLLYTEHDFPGVHFEALVSITKDRKQRVAYDVFAIDNCLNMTYVHPYVPPISRSPLQCSTFLALTMKRMPCLVLRVLTFDWRFHITRGRVIPRVGWNDVNNTDTEEKFSITISSYLSILCKNGESRESLKLFHDVVNGLDPPMKIDGVCWIFQWIGSCPGLSMLLALVVTRLLTNQHLIKFNSRTSLLFGEGWR